MTIPKPRPRIPWGDIGVGIVLMFIVGAIVLPGLLSSGCIVEGTLVDTPAGPRPIQDLRAGEEVWSRGPGGEPRVGRVVRILPARSWGYLRILFADGGLLCATGDHPIATPTGFAAAKTLLPGATVRGSEGTRTIASIESSSSVVRVYDLEVASEPNFIAAGVVVHNKSSPERNASYSLKTLTSAQFGFRANDSDGNQTNDFWVGDIAGFYCLESDGRPLKLIELSVAGADVAPLTAVSKYAPPSPKAGYHYAVIPYQADGKPYDSGNNRSTSGYAFCAFPAEYARWKGRYTLIVSENNTVYWKDDPKPHRIRQWPADLAAEGWKKLDW